MGAVDPDTGARPLKTIKMKKAKLRGVVSEGMLLSGAELGLDGGRDIDSAGLLDCRDGVASLAKAAGQAGQAVDLAGVSVAQVLEAMDWAGLGSVEARTAALAAWTDKISGFEEAAAVLEWDRHVNLPAEGGPGRGRQLDAVRSASNAELRREDMEAVLVSLEADPRVHHAAASAGSSSSSSSDGLGAVPASVRVARKRRAYRVGVPDALVEAESAAVSRALSEWTATRTLSDPQTLQDVIDAKRAVYEAVDRTAAGVTGSELYDVALAEYGTGLSGAELSSLFVGELAPALKQFVGRVSGGRGGQSGRVADALNAPPRDASEASEWMAVYRDVAEQLGFDFSAGRLDVSAHPFTIAAGRQDVRITTRTQTFLEGLTATIHEAGHGMYEQGLGAGPAAGTFGGAMHSVGVHESQAIFYERFVGQSLAFWEWLWPQLLARVPSLPRDATALDAHRVVNAGDGETGLRVCADEIRYALHIILRTGLEEAMINGQLAAAELESAWAARADELGIPEAAGPGPYQDMHWVMGAFGYFPSYTLGSVIAAQLYEDALGEVPALAAGEFPGALGEVKAFLAGRVHTRGSLPGRAGDFVGGDLDSGVLLAHLDRQSLLL